MKNRRVPRVSHQSFATPMSTTASCSLHVGLVGHVPQLQEEEEEEQQQQKQKEEEESHNNKSKVFRQRRSKLATTTRVPDGGGPYVHRRRAASHTTQVHVHRPLAHTHNARVPTRSLFVLSLQLLLDARRLDIVRRGRTQYTRASQHATPCRTQTPRQARCAEHPGTVTPHSTSGAHREDPSPPPLSPIPHDPARPRLASSPQLTIDIHRICTSRAENEQSLRCSLSR